MGDSPRSTHRESVGLDQWLFQEVGIGSVMSAAQDEIDEHTKISCLKMRENPDRFVLPRQLDDQGHVRQRRVDATGFAMRVELSFVVRDHDDQRIVGLVTGLVRELAIALSDTAMCSSQEGRCRGNSQELPAVLRNEFVRHLISSKSVVVEGGST